MWRYLRKRRALKAYRTKLFKHLRRTYGRKLYYSTDEVRTGIRTIGVSVDYECYALSMLTERAMFDAYHAATGEVCDYDAMRAEIFAHAPRVPVSVETGAGHWWVGDSVGNEDGSSCDSVSSGDTGSSDCGGGGGD
ncbi:MAG: hypothetical protein H0T46_36990 [Deltaproteobacteria bacterium]|nr:hypothetical protein [Deltaproteobacteria bacterium]